MSQSKLTYNISPIYYIVYKLVYIFKLKNVINTI